MNRGAVFLFMLVAGCGGSDVVPDAAMPVDAPIDGATIATTTLSLDMIRQPRPGLDPFEVVVTVRVDGVPTAGRPVTATVPRGTATAVVDRQDGTYAFTVTPTTTGVYPVEVSADGLVVRRSAIVLEELGDGVGQPMAVPGDHVNTPGYEDGVTISPDGQYLFVQYGPIYFSGFVFVTQICGSASYTVGYDLNTCAGRPNSNLVFDPIGPIGPPLRPGFHDQVLSNGKLRHLPGIVIPDASNGLVSIPTMLYGFRRQPDGTFAEPFRVYFDDPKGVNGPFGLSLVPRADGTTTFALAWDNFLNNLGDDGADIYTGTMTLGEDEQLGTVTYGTLFDGDSFASITPTITPVSFSSHAGVQGNPHLTTDSAGAINAIWVDDERTTKDLYVYRLTAGTFPTGTWVRDTLPAPVNTAEEEDQPFFTGTSLVLSRGLEIVAHPYQPTSGACAGGYASSDCWGAATVLLGASTSTSPGTITAVGEPTIATVGGKRYLYFAYVEVRDPPAATGALVDLDLNAGFVEIP